MDSHVVREKVIPMLEEMANHMDLVLEEVPIDNDTNYMKEVLVSLQSIHTISGNLRDILIDEIRKYTDTIAREDDEKKA